MQHQYRWPDAFDLERRRTGQRDVGRADTRLAERLSQPLHLRLALNPQGIVGLDAKDEVDAPLEVETQFDGPQPIQSGDVRPLPFRLRGSL